MTHASNMKYVVDTSIISKLVDGKIDPSELPTDGEFIISHNQIDELNKTKDKESERRAQLFLRFAQVAPKLAPTESIVLGTSRFSHAKFGAGITYQKLKNALDALNKRKPINIHDALIAETAIKNGFALLTADYHLKVVVESNGGQVRYWKRP
jgi:predicted nucleic acid-binding protein